MIELLHLYIYLISTLRLVTSHCSTDEIIDTGIKDQVYWNVRTVLQHLQVLVPSQSTFEGITVNSGTKENPLWPKRTKRTDKPTF